MFAVLPHDGEGLAPIALTRKEPVAELKLNARFADPVLRESGDDLRLRVRRGEPVERPAVHGETLVAENFQRLGIARRFIAKADARFLCHDFADGQRKLLQETLSNNNIPYSHTDFSFA